MEVPWKHPSALTDAFSWDPRKVEERQTFLACASLLIDEPDMPAVVCEFIMPAVRAAIDDRRVSGRWRPTT